MPRLGPKIIGTARKKVDNELLDEFGVAIYVMKGKKGELWIQVRQPNGAKMRMTQVNFGPNGGDVLMDPK